MGIKEIYRKVLTSSLRKSITNFRLDVKDKFVYCLVHCFDVKQYPYKKYHDKHKCIFIHIPKNAGTSVLQLFAGNTAITGGRIHERYRTYFESNPKKFNNYEKFCIVRNPWDRLLSAYIYLINGGNKTCDLSFSEVLKKEAPTFEIFVKEWLKLDKIYNITVLQPQFFYIYDFQNKKMMVDTILRLENLEADFEKFKSKIGISESISVTNKTKHKKYIEYYDDEMIEIVYRLYQYDVELLQYTFTEEK